MLREQIATISPMHGECIGDAYAMFVKKTGQRPICIIPLDTFPRLISSQRHREDIAKTSANLSRCVFASKIHRECIADQWDHRITWLIHAYTIEYRNATTPQVHFFFSKMSNTQDRLPHTCIYLVCERTSPGLCYKCL